MAIAEFRSGALVNKQWSMGLEAEVLAKTPWMDFLASRRDSLFCEKDELKKDKGDTITWGFRKASTGAPRVGNQRLKGFERDFEVYDESMVIDLARDAVAVENITSRQFVNFEPREEARIDLGQFMNQVLDKSAWNQLTGNVIESAQGLIGQNTVLDRLEDWTVRPTNRADNDSLVPGDNFSLRLIDIAVERAKTGASGSGPRIQPAWIPMLKREMYVAFIHTYHVSQLRETDSDWYALWLNAMTGGKIDGNPIMTGTLGIHNNTLLVEVENLPNAVNAAGTALLADTKNAVLCGAGSLYVGFGRAYGGKEKFVWVEEEDDFGMELGIAAGVIFGMKRPTYGDRFERSILIPTYATESVDS